MKVGDFGFSTKLDDSSYRDEVCGTPSYMAPEVFDSSYGGYSYEADIWAFGVCIYEMFTGYKPFIGDSKDKKSLFRKIKSG